MFCVFDVTFYIFMSLPSLFIVVVAYFTFLSFKLHAILCQWLIHSLTIYLPVLVGFSPSYNFIFFFIAFSFLFKDHPVTLLVRLISLSLSPCTPLCPTLWRHGLPPARLLCPWDFPGKNTSGLPWSPPGDPGDFPYQGIKSTSPASPTVAGGFLTREPPEK